MPYLRDEVNVLEVLSGLIAHDGAEEALVLVLGDVGSLASPQRLLCKVKQARCE